MRVQGCCVRSPGAGGAWSKWLVGLICYERFPRGMGGGFQSGPSGMAEGLMLGSARFWVDQMQAGDISPGRNIWE